MSQSTPINMIRRGDPGIDPQQMPQMQQMQQMPPQQQQQQQQQMGGMGGNDMQGFNPMGHSDSQLVEDILKEMGDSPGIEQQTNINSQAFQYATDNSQIPAYKQQPPQQLPQQLPYDNYADKMIMQQSNNGLLSQIGINLSGDSIKDKIIKNIKYPGLVFIICLIISLPEFNRFLFGFFPRLLLESGQVSIGGVFLKAIIGMILFAIVGFFI